MSTYRGQTMSTTQNPVRSNAAPIPAGKKYDDNKTRFDLLPPKSLTLIADVLAAGARKYHAYNWKGGIAYSRLYAATLRHLMAWWDGQDKDPETAISHLAHAGCCLMFLLEFETTRSDLDDRPHTVVPQKQSA